MPQLLLTCFEEVRSAVSPVTVSPFSSKTLSGRVLIWFLFSLVSFAFSLGFSLPSGILTVAGPAINVSAFEGADQVNHGTQDRGNLQRLQRSGCAKEVADVDKSEKAAEPPNDADHTAPRHTNAFAVRNSHARVAVDLVIVFSIAELTNSDGPGIPPDMLGLPKHARFNLKLALFKLQSEVSPIFQVSCATKARLDRPVERPNLTALRVIAKLACMDVTSIT